MAMESRNRITSQHCDAEQGMEAILKFTVRQDAALGADPRGFTCKQVAEEVHIPVRQVRRCLREMERNGYIREANVGGACSHDGETFYTLTDRYAVSCSIRNNLHHFLRKDRIKHAM